MALVPDQKFSTFIDGGNLAISDIVVGLRGGLNTKFNYTGDLPPGFIVPISQGGTGATTAPGARINLGLGTIATQDASAVAITGGTAILTSLQTPTILDANGNTMVSFNTAPIAVNHLQIQNGATTGPVVLQAVGTDTNISIFAITQGTGHFVIDAATTNPLSINSGMGLQHLTNFIMADTATTRNVTFQDASGTLAYLTDIPSGSPSALTKTDDTNVTLTLGGTPATALLEAVSLTLGWTGALSGTRGGTGVNNGASTITIGGSLVLSGAFASTFTFTGITGVTFPTSGTLATTSQIPTGAALTKTDDTNVTLTLGGSPTAALVNAASLTLGWTGQLGLTRGGTAASLTASNGGIVYSTASALAILAGTATAGQMLQSGASTTPAWSTSTYPATNAINTLLYASSANVMAALATANNGILVTSAGGVPSIGNTVGAGLTMPSITFNSTSGVIGTTTNNNAAAGSVGEVILSNVAVTNVSLTSGTVADATSISLTAGDWDVYGTVGFFGNAATTPTLLKGWISTTSATDPGSPNYVSVFPSGVPFATAPLDFNVPFVRVSLAGTTTVYLTVQAVFGTSTCTGGGVITARRAR